MPQFSKDPDETLDYMIDWADWLGTDMISTSAWTVETGLTKVSDSKTTTTTTIWVSGGTAGQDYIVTNRIVTAGGRTSDRSIVIYIREEEGTFTYRGDLSTDRDRVRFYIQDTTANSGPKPDGGNFTDAEFDGLITAEGDWQRAVAGAFEVLAGLWGQYVDIAVGPRRESLSQTAERYATLAADWRTKFGASASGAGTRFVTRVDGYSDDVAADEV